MTKTQDIVKSGPVVWLGQSVDSSNICSCYPELSRAPFLTSLGCAIRRPSLRETHFNSTLREKLQVTGPLMIDSGGFVLSTKPNAGWTVRTVAKSIAKIEADIFVTLDYPPHLTDKARKRREKIVSSINNFEFLSERFPDKVIMPVIHGRTISEIELSVCLLKKKNIRKEWIGLGGMVPLLQRRRVSKEISLCGPEVFIAQALTIVRKEFPYSILHVFGAGGTRTFPAVYAFGADSSDSIGWRQVAGFGSIFLPLKSQRVVSWNSKKRLPRRLLDESDLEQLEKCKCPICRTKPTIESLLSDFRNSYHSRSIHNAWTIINQKAYWPTSRSGMLSLIARGSFGPGWAKATDIHG